MTMIARSVSNRAQDEDKQKEEEVWPQTALHDRSHHTRSNSCHSARQ